MKEYIKITYFLITLIIIFILYPILLLCNSKIYIPMLNSFKTDLICVIILAVNFLISGSKILMDEYNKNFPIKVVIITIFIMLFTVIADLGNLDGKYYEFKSPDNRYTVVIEETKTRVVAYKKVGVIIMEKEVIFADFYSDYVLKNNNYKIEWFNNVMRFYYKRKLGDSYCYEDIKL